MVTKLRVWIKVACLATAGMILSSSAAYPLAPSSRFEGTASVVERLKMKIAAKEEEFKLRAGSFEEVLDRERALGRMRRLGAIAQELLEKYPQEPDLFEQYLRDVAEPLLSRDARTLNFILASTEALRLWRFQNFVALKTPLIIVRDELRFLVKRKDKWEAARNDFYLPGLRIVVEGAGLSRKGRLKLERAARLIGLSGWLAIHPESLKHLESIIPREGAEGSYAGRTGEYMAGHAVVELDDHPALRLAEVLIHEDRHDINRAHPRWSNVLYLEFPKEVYERLEEIHHPWLTHLVGRRGAAGHLMNEVDAYGAGSEFLLRLWETRGFDPEHEWELAEELMTARGYARSALQALRKAIRKAPLDKELSAWLRELEALWKNLGARIESRWDEALAALVASADPLHRYYGYTFLAKRSVQEKKRGKFYRERFTQALSRERDEATLRLLGTSEDIPVRFRMEAAEHRVSLKSAGLLTRSKWEPALSVFSYKQGDASESYGAAGGERRVSRGWMHLAAPTGGLYSSKQKAWLAEALESLPKDRPAKILLVGAGRGRAILDLVWQYPDRRFEFHSINREPDLLYDLEHIVTYLNPTILNDESLDDLIREGHPIVKEARRLFGLLHSSVHVMDIAGGKGLEKLGKDFNLIIVGTAVKQYIPDQLTVDQGLYRLLREGGKLFTYVERVRVFSGDSSHVLDTDQLVKEIRGQLGPGAVRLIMGPSAVTGADFASLMITKVNAGWTLPFEFAWHDQHGDAYRAIQAGAPGAAQMQEGAALLGTQP